MPRGTDPPRRAEMAAWITSTRLLLIAALLLFAAIALSAVSQRMGVPSLLVFLAVGLVATELPGAPPVEIDVSTAALIGNLALAVILLDGGLRTRFGTLRMVAGPALTLATVGVLVTASAVGATAVALLGFDWRYGLLLGAIVGSTDAAAVFALLGGGGLRLNERVEATLEVESGLNDPMAVFLTVAHDRTDPHAGQRPRHAGAAVPAAVAGRPRGRLAARQGPWPRRRPHPARRRPVCAADPVGRPHGVCGRQRAGRQRIPGDLPRRHDRRQSAPARDRRRAARQRRLRVARPGGDVPAARHHHGHRRTDHGRERPGPAGGPGADAGRAPAGGRRLPAAVPLSAPGDRLHRMGRDARRGADRAGAVSRCWPDCRRRRCCSTSRS